MTEAQWNAVQQLDGCNMYHPTYGLVVGKMSANTHGEVRFVISFNTNAATLYSYVLRKDWELNDVQRRHLRSVYDYYRKHMNLNI